MATKDKNITFRIHPALKRILESIAKEERRSLSNQLRIALEEWLKMKEEIHPQFIKDIKESIASGKPESVWKG